MRTLLTGQQGTPALCPANRAFFYLFFIFFLFFWREIFFFEKKNVSLSVPFSLVVHALSVFCGHVKHCTWGYLPKIKGKAPLHAPSITTEKMFSGPNSSMTLHRRSQMNGIVLSAPEQSAASRKECIPSTPRITLTTGLLVVDYHPTDMRVPPTFFIRGFSLDMPSSSSLLSVAGIIFLVNFWRCGKVVSLFPRAVPLPMHTAV